MSWDSQVQCPYCHHILDVNVEISANVEIESIEALTPRGDNQGPTVKNELKALDEWNKIMDNSI